jgi:hypothetical protein
MKRTIIVIIALFVVLAAIAVAAEKSKLDLKAGDTIYACNCGDKCACKTMSRTETNCTCGNKMVKATVARMDGNTAMLKAAGWDKERAFPIQGKYACACAGECNCGTISQNPGKCACGNEMKKVEM